MLLNGPDRYGVVSRAIHWITALLFFVMLGVGLWTGLLVFGLTLFRLLWLVITPPPPLPDTLQAWEILLARFVRILMYVLLLAIPVAGYLNLAYDGQGATFYGLFTIPPLVAENHALHEAFEEVHELLVWSLLFLVLLHIAGALKHRYELGPGVDVLRRML